MSKGGLVDRHTWPRRVGQYGAGRASEALQPPGADLEPERFLQCDVLQLVGLIEHHQVVGGSIAPAARAVVGTGGC